MDIIREEDLSADQIKNADDTVNARDTGKRLLASRSDSTSFKDIK